VLVLVCVAACLVLAGSSQAQVFYTLNGEQECSEVAQMWYDGYWKSVREEKEERRAMEVLRWIQSLLIGHPISTTKTLAYGYRAV
jgi:hypothetical protein